MFGARVSRPLSRPDRPLFPLLDSASDAVLRSLSTRVSTWHMSFASVDTLFPTPSLARLVYAGVSCLGAAYYCNMFARGFYAGIKSLFTYSDQGEVKGGEKAFSWKMYFLLCSTESSTPAACGIMLASAGWLSPVGAAAYAIGCNACGYLKYYLQMFMNKDYVATSIWLYSLSFLTLAILQKDPLYFVLMWYPFRYVLLKVPTYGAMRQRRILDDDASIALHSVDHILHGLITCRVMLYHYYGPLPILLIDPVLMPLCYWLSDEMVKIQQGISCSQTQLANNGKKVEGSNGKSLPGT